MLKRKLVQIGLSDNESIIYQLLLEEGSCTAQKLYTTTGINRVTVYNVLESLSNKGLISSLDTEKKKLFIAESPKRLINFLENQKLELEKFKKEVNNNEEKLQKFLPELEILYESKEKNKPEVRFFEGIEGIKNIREEIINSQANLIFNIFSQDNVNSVETDDKDKEKARDSLIRKNIKSKMLYSYNKGKKFPHIKKNNEEYYYIENPDLNFSAEIVIYGDKITFISIEKNNQITGTVIKNKKIAQTLENLFLLAIKNKNDVFRE